MSHILKGVNPKEKEFNIEGAKQRLSEWITTELSTEKCSRPKSVGARETACTCMKDIFNDPNSPGLSLKVANYQIYWKSLKLDARRGIIHAWIQTSDVLKPLVQESGQKSRKIFMLPVLVDEGEQETQGYQICRDALWNLLDIGPDLWKAGCSNPMMVNKNRNKKGTESAWGKKNAEVNASMHEFLNDLKQNHSLPFATRLVRDETGLTTRDDDVDEVALPPNYSMRRCYELWCLSRGYKPTFKSSAKSIYNKINDYALRENDEDDWPIGSEPQQVCAWETFRSYWWKHFPKMKIRKKGADVCTDCLMLANSFRSRSNRQQRRGEDVQAEQEEDLENTIMYTREVIARAEEHVRAYQIQKKMKQDIIVSAMNEITQNLPSLYRKRVFTIDMGQNLGIPNFEGEQPGDTFYLTPLTVLLFGVVDNTTQVAGKEHMNAYVWQEFEGDRGANNIASCLLRDLKLRGLLNQPNHGELVYIADNCGGQNKNKIVIRFLMWLAEMAFFPKVSIQFLIKGHTKNAADRHFNLLKLEYHKRNIYTYGHLIDALDTNEHVTVHTMKPNDFRDHLKWQDIMYRKPDKNFNNSHVFCIHANNPLVLLKQDHAQAPIREDNLKPTNRNRKARQMDAAERDAKLKEMEDKLEELIPTPLKPIKQVELYKKWRPLIPLEFREITCPKPSDEVIEAHKRRTREKAQASRARKKIQLTTPNNNSST